MSEYSIRIDDLQQGQDKTRVIAWITGIHPEAWLITQEHAKITGKLHYHAYIKTSLSLKQLRNKFNYQFMKTHKKGQYALALARNPENLLSYIMKDTTPIYTSFTSDELSSFKAWIPKDEYKYKSSVLTKLKHAIKAKTLEDITMKLMEYYDNNNMPFDKFRMKAYAYAIYYHNNDKDDNTKQWIKNYILT